MDPAHYCRETAAPRGSALYYAVMDYPAPERTAVIALHALGRELQGIAAQPGDEAVARTKLAWWRTELERLFAGQPAHPVTQSLQQGVDHFELAHEHFQELCDGIEMDLEQVRYDTFRELTLYCHRIAGVLGTMTAQVFGYTDRHTPHHAHTIATGLQLGEWVADARTLAERGRIYIPREELERFSLSAADLTYPRTSDRVQGLFGMQTARARDYIDRGMNALAGTDRYRQRGHLVLGAIGLALLDELEKDGFKVLEQRITLTPLRRFWIGWRTLRREQRRHKRARR